MINNFKIETKLGLRYYNGGASEGSTNSQGTSSSQSGGISQSNSQAQLNPSQLLSAYSQGLPSMLSTANNAVQSTAAAPALNAATTGATNAVNAINLNGLSPGEGNAIERSTNQQNQASGNLGVNNATNTTANAMNFGNAINSKIGLMNSTTANAANVANAGTNALSGVSSIFNPIAANANTAVSNSNSLYGAQSQGQNTGSGSNSSMQGGLCYLTTACCSYKGLPDDCEELQVLRHFRDTYVPKGLVDDYYALQNQIMPKVVANSERLEYIWQTIRQCVQDIKNDNKESALNRYTKMVEYLKGLQ
jgi:hypothetical protein